MNIHFAGAVRLVRAINPANAREKLVGQQLEFAVKQHGHRAVDDHLPYRVTFSIEDGNPKAVFTSENLHPKTFRPKKLAIFSEPVGWFVERALKESHQHIRKFYKQPHFDQLGQ